jgi:hypothetical protein
MGGFRVGGLAAAIVALALPASAAAGTFTLHPSGFGEHSYSAWKGDEGLPDSTGNKEHALYFQKKTSTATFAAGVAVIKGFEGMPTSAANPLEFWVRLDGHCGAGAPRFNLRFQPEGTTDPEQRETRFFGCAAMVPGGLLQREDRIFQRRTVVGPFPEGTIVSISIVYDEGIEFPPGHVHLDNIRVGPHQWTSASDNSSGEEIIFSTTPLEELLGEPVTTLFP